MTAMTKHQLLKTKKEAMFSKKRVNVNLLQMVDGNTAYDTYKVLVDMAPTKSSIMRAILAEVPLVCSIDMEAYVLEHQGIHSRLMKPDPQGTTEASTRPAQMTRLLDGLSPEQQLIMNFLMFS